MKIIRFVFISCVAVLLLGCDTLPRLETLGRLLNSGATPEQAVEQLLPSGSRYFYVTKFMPGGAVVFFRSLNPRANEITVGHSYVKWEIIGWTAGGISIGGSPDPNAPYALGVSFPAELPDQIFFEGVTLDPKISRVQVSLADGIILREPIVNNLFGIILPIEPTVCRFELRDSQDQLLYGYDLASSTGNIEIDELRARAEKECK